MKDELNGHCLKNFAALRPKIYSYLSVLEKKDYLNFARNDYKIMK